MFMEKPTVLVLDGCSHDLDDLGVQLLRRSSRRPRACHPHQRIDGRRASNFVSIVLVASDRLKSEATAAPFRKTRLRASSAAIGSPSATAKNT